MELEKAVAPRQIQYLMRGNASNIDVLKQFAGKSVRIECISDWEARRAASNLADLLKRAGWNLEGDAVMVLDEPMQDGVMVYQYLQPDGERWDSSVWRAADMVDEVVSWLHANNWSALHRWSKHGELKPDEIKISVGFKPAPSLSDPLRGLTAAMLEDKRAEEIKKQIDALKLTPEEIKKILKRFKRPNK